MKVERHRNRGCLMAATAFMCPNRKTTAHTRATTAGPLEASGACAMMPYPRAPPSRVSRAWMMARYPVSSTRG